MKVPQAALRVACETFFPKKLSKIGLYPILMKNTTGNNIKIEPQSCDKNEKRLYTAYSLFLNTSQLNSHGLQGIHQLLHCSQSFIRQLIIAGLLFCKALNRIYTVLHSSLQLSHIVSIS